MKIQPNPGTPGKQNAEHVGVKVGKGVPFEMMSAFAAGLHAQVFMLTSPLPCCIVCWHAKILLFHRVVRLRLRLAGNLSNKFRASH